jgi:hypothetical protein
MLKLPDGNGDSALPLLQNLSPADERNLSCRWKHLKWRHYSIKRRLFNVRRRLFSAKRRLFKTLHRRANVLSPNTNHPYTHIYPDFHPWPTPHTQYYRPHPLVLPNGFGSIGKQIVIADSENKKSSLPYPYFFVQIRKFPPSPLLILSMRGQQRRRVVSD